MPRYSYGQNGPADWAATQQARRDDQIRTILNMMMQIKNQQTEQGWKEKEWDYGQSQDSLANARADMLAKAQAANYAEVPAVRTPAPTNLQERVKLLETDPDTYNRIYPPSSSPSASDTTEKDYRKAVAEIHKRYAMEEIKADAAYREEVAAIRKTPKLREMEKGSLSMSPYGTALAGALTTYKQRKELLPQLKQKELEALDIEYGKKKPSAAMPSVKKPDKFGFSLDEERPDATGKIWKYVGNNKWASK